MTSDTTGDILRKEDKLTPVTIENTTSPKVSQSWSDIQSSTMSCHILTKNNVQITSELLIQLNISMSQVFGTEMSKLGHRGKC